MKTLIFILFPFFSFCQYESKLIQEIYQEDSPLALVSIAKKHKLRTTIEIDGIAFDNKFFRVYKEIDGSVYFYLRYSKSLFNGFKKELDLNYRLIDSEQGEDELSLIYDNNSESQWELAHFPVDGDEFIVYGLSKK